jgi:hypothetical protein
VRISLHPELADAFQNSRRSEIVALESEFDLNIEVIASNRLHRPDQEIEWVERSATDQKSGPPSRNSAAILASQIARPQTATSASKKSGDQPKSQEQRESDSAGRPKPKRRRPRRRSSKSTAAAPQETPPSVSHPIAAATSPPLGDAKSGAPLTPQTTPKKRFRRRRRRKPVAPNVKAKTTIQNPSASTGKEAPQPEFTAAD